MPGGFFGHRHILGGRRGKSTYRATSIFEDARLAGPPESDEPEVSELLTRALSSNREEATGENARRKRERYTPQQLSPSDTADVQDTSSPRLSTHKIRPGAKLLLRFLRDLGPGIGHSHFRSTLYGDISHLNVKTDWVYNLDQGCETTGLRAIREQMAPRLYRKGPRLLGPGWALLLLGEDFAKVPSNLQKHVLHYRLMECCCLKCLVNRVKEEQDCPSVGSFDLDEIPADVSGGVDNLGQVDHIGECNANTRAFDIATEDSEGYAHVQTSGKRRSSNSDGARVAFRIVQSTSCRNSPMNQSHMRGVHLPAIQSCQLPDAAELTLLGAFMNKTVQYEIGTVNKLHSRSRSNFIFSETMQQFAVHAAYTGSKSFTELYSQILHFSRKHYDAHQGKRERRVYLRGEMHIFQIPLSVLLVERAPLNIYEQNCCAIIAREQRVRLFHGTVVLEGSYGSFITTDIPWYIGFGEDNGAQALYPDGRLGSPRPLGINELCMHTTYYEKSESKMITLT